MPGYFIVNKKTIIKNLKQLPNDFPMKIIEDVRQWRNPEAHKRDGDFFVCLKGEARFICGGKLIRPRFRLNTNGGKNKNELYAEKIAGGTKIFLKKGDCLWISAGEPHQHGSIGIARLGIIKIPN